MMKTCTALVRVRSTYAPSASILSRQLRERAIEAAAGPRVWMERLEPRYFMDATAATVALDPAFGQGGLASPLPPNRTALTATYSHLTPAGEGKFYAITYGNPTYPYGYDAFEVIRINGDGSLDPTFTPPHFEHQSMATIGWGPDSQQELVSDSLLVNSVLVQPDGKVVVVARDVPYESPDPFLVMRFNMDGSADQMFGEGGTTALSVDPGTAGLPFAWLTADGKIDVINVAHFGSGESIQVIVRQINTDGILDESFGTAGQLTVDVPTDFAQFASHDPASVGGWVLDPAGTEALPDGSFITYLNAESWSYSEDGNSGGTHTEIIQLRLSSAGEILQNRTIFAHDFVSGSDNSGDSPAPTVTVQPDGRALLFNSSAMSLQRFNVDGSLDSTFNSSPASLLPAGFEGGTETFLPQSDGSILVGVTDASEFYSGIERLRENGSIDSSFAGGQVAFGFAQGQSIDEAVTLTDGSIVASVFNSPFPGYWFTHAGDATPPAIARILPMGGTANTYDIKAAETEAQAAYDAMHPPYVPVTTDPLPPNDGIDPIETLTGGDPSADPSTGIGSTDGSTTDGSDLTSDPLAGAGLSDRRSNAFANTGGKSFFDSADGSDLFNPDGTRRVFEDGSSAV